MVTSCREISNKVPHSFKTSLNNIIVIKLIGICSTCTINNEKIRIEKNLKFLCTRLINVKNITKTKMKRVQNFQLYKNTFLSNI